MVTSEPTEIKKQQLQVRFSIVFYMNMFTYIYRESYGSDSKCCSGL